MSIAQHSMTLGEERFYHAVWHAKEADGVARESAKSKVFSLGYDRLARMVRLDEKSVRLLIPKLVAKKILEVLAPEVSASRVGRTYRIFSYEEILERQRAANLQYIVKKGRAVEFVFPQSIDEPTVDQTPTVGVSPPEGSSSSVGFAPTGAVGERPVISVRLTPTPLDTAPDTLFRQTSPVFRALQEFGIPDDDAVKAVIANCRRNDPHATMEEIVHFIQEKGKITKSGKIANPIAFLIVYVPKCFQGESLDAYRDEMRKQREREEAEAKEIGVLLEEERRMQQAILDDPAASDGDKRWASHFLSISAGQGTEN